MRLAVHTSQRTPLVGTLEGIDVAWFDDLASAIEACREADAVWLPIGNIAPGQVGQVVTAASRLRWIHVSNAGVEMLPLELLRERGAILTNGAGLHAEPIADHVIACILAAARGLPALMRAQFDHRWAPELAGRREVFGSEVLIIGYGQIGRAIASRVKALGMEVIGVRRKAGDEPGVVSGDA